MSEEIEEIALSETLMAAAENNAAAAKSAETQAKLVELGLTGGGEPVDVSAWRVAWEADYGYGNNAMFDKPQKPIGNLTIPNGVECIGYGRFDGCGVSGELRIPPSVKTLRGQSFRNNGISEVVFEGDIETIEREAFRQCENLESVTFPEDTKNLKEIPDYCFRDCWMLSQINIPKSVTRIGKEAFVFAKIPELVLHEGIEIIDYDAFAASSLQCVVFPKTINQIGHRSFAECNSLTDVIFEAPSNLEAISSEAFSECLSLKSIVLPESVKTIGEGCFGICENLETIKFPSQLERIGPTAFTGCHSLNTSGEVEHTLIFPETLVEIGYEAFAECREIFTFAFLSADITIGSDAFYSIDEDATLIFDKKTKTEVMAMDYYPWGAKNFATSGDSWSV